VTRDISAREHIEVVAGGRLRQRPGRWNALGGVKFVAPNDYGVFLHDTPARTLFSRSSRAFSHGCMRLEKPYELAAWLLRDDPRWTSETIGAAAWSGTERSIRLREPLPLHVLYWTAWVDERGILHFVDDVYGRNAPLREALTRAVRHTRP
jgi:L,D-transpeptidase YcbB